MLGLQALKRATTKSVREHAGARMWQARRFSVRATARASADTFSTGDNSFYIQTMYEDWQKDPSSVHASWDAYFKGIGKGVNPAAAFAPPPSEGVLAGLPADGVDAFAGSSLDDQQKIQLLVRAYQVRGHVIAELDPLHLTHGRAHESGGFAPELTIEHYGWSEADLDKEYSLGPGILPQFKAAGIDKLKLRDIVANLKKIYSSTIGFQYAHIPDRRECDWLRERIERPDVYSYGAEDKKLIFNRLAQSALFEQYIAHKYPTAKRFGLEGGETAVVGLKAFIDQSVKYGVRDVNIAMAHRGRLNVLANVVHKPVEAILNEFSPPSLAENPDLEPMADVKYHLGANWAQDLDNGEKLNIVMEANPSHLESANGIVLGRTRAVQDRAHSSNQAVSITIHGDAAFAGQGVVYESLLLHDLPAFKTDGTFHVIINNQIGFTTDPTFGRSTPYASDIGKAIAAPIFHVNADDPEAVHYVSTLAADFRNEFKKDVIIDLICYRRHGHNEIDQPSFTQPIMYSAVEKTPPSIDIYQSRLLEEKSSLDDAALKSLRDSVWDGMEAAFEASKDYKPHPKEWLSSKWEDFPSPTELAENVLPQGHTGVSKDILSHVGNIVSNAPPNFTIHRNLKRILTNRAKAFESGEGIDYPTAELLAFGSLALEGNAVRLAGQDVERGTFSQRHAVLHDQKTGEIYPVLQHLSEDQAPVDIVNSPLSEYGVLSFELGYSLVSPDQLNIWEAQFGDFANGGQIVIDQFIAAGEKKWTQRSGLVLNLPHGFDGQGPEHSSARMERFLQLTEDNPYVYPSEAELQRQHQDANIQILVPSTPATIFHALRRQVHRAFRKPLVVFMSKALLRHPLARSSLDDLSGDTVLQRYLPEPEPEGFAAPSDVKRHILCAGQVYYTLLAEREKRGITDIAISRVEQVSPFPFDSVTPHLDHYPNADIYWVQEEPLNNGAWSYVKPRIDTALKQTSNHAGKSLNFAGREPTCSVATGSGEKHAQEIEQFLDDAFNLDRQFP